MLKIVWSHPVRFSPVSNTKFVCLLYFLWPLLNCFHLSTYPLIVIINHLYVCKITNLPTHPVTAIQYRYREGLDAGKLHSISIDVVQQKCHKIKEEKLFTAKTLQPILQFISELLCQPFSIQQGNVCIFNRIIQ